MIVPDNAHKAIRIIRKSIFASDTTNVAIAATTTLAEDARAMSARYMAKKLRSKAIEVREFGHRYGAQDRPTRSYIALLLLLRDQFGFRYWDDLTRVACACAAAGAHDHSQVEAYLKTAPLSSKSEQALVLYRNQMAGEPHGHN